MDREGHDDEIRRSRRQKIVNSSKMQIREKRKTEFHAAGSEPTEFCKYQKFSSLTTSERKSSELSDNIKRDLVFRESSERGVIKSTIYRRTNRKNGGKTFRGGLRR